jgi:hypothetical protein
MNYWVYILRLRNGGMNAAKWIRENLLNGRALRCRD